MFMGWDLDGPKKWERRTLQISQVFVGLHLMFPQAVSSPRTVLALPVRPTLSARPVAGSETVREERC